MKTDNIILKKNIFLIIIYVLASSFGNELSSQEIVKERVVYVDRGGVMRWADNKSEVKGFGTNYSVPFAHAYRTAERMGIDVKKVIDDDIYHFTRLGFDLFRVHVWDTQISDTLGNLIKNKHLDTFDYLISKLKEQKINYLITPIAYWGNGWPEPDTESPGFSHKYGKKEALINEGAIKAQQNYLFQFLNHQNPYTKLRYKEDPSLIAFEVSNEPHHQGEAKEVREFVKKMLTSMRKTGTKKPIFYNMSHAVHFADAYFDGGVQGGTFQWYPTGLLYGKELSGNLLPNVDSYNIPFEDTFKKYHGAKLVYEFDAADVGKSYIYPAMARSFRTAGIQLATHFTYEPTFMAANNTEYNSHYMNLTYTPSKAISLKICSEIFHSVPMYTTFGKYPQNTRFGHTYINYEKDLAIFNSETKYFYTNDHDQRPVNEFLLSEIAGFGNSPLVRYNGKGAYFLDKVDNGVWRLELMPNTVWVKDPFGRNNYENKVAVIDWKEHAMKLNIEDLKTSFSITAINDGNDYEPDVDGNNFTIYPGTYIITRNNAQNKWDKNTSFKGYQLKTFFAPISNIDNTYLYHNPIAEISDKKNLVIKAQIVSNDIIKKVELKANHSGQAYFQLAMNKVDEYQYEVELDSNYVKKGFINYNIVVTQVNGEHRTYPADKKGDLYDWDFNGSEPYTTQVVTQENPIYLFDAKYDTKDLIATWRKGFKLVPTANYNEAEYQMVFSPLYQSDPENLNASPIYDYSFKHSIQSAIKGRITDLATKKQLVFSGRSLYKTPVKIQVAVVLKNGSSFGKVIELSTKMSEQAIDLSDLRRVKTVTLPRPYPSFLKYYFDDSGNNEPFDLKNAESIQISIGPGIPKKQLNKKIGIAFTRIWIE